MLRALAIFFGLVALFVVTGELCLRSRESAELRRIETAAEHELLGGGLDGLLHARALALGGAAHARDAEVAATLGLADAMLASEYGLNQADAALASARGTDAPGVSRRAGALKLATRALAEVTSGRLDRAEALALESVALGHKLASPLFALGRIRFRQGNLPAASRAFQAALVREPSLVEARVAWAEVWLEEGARDRAREALVAVLRRTLGHSRAQLLLAELDLASSDAPGEATAWQAACARDEKNSPFLMGACDLARAQRAARSHDGDGAIRFAAAAGHRRPAEPRVLAGAAQVLASLGAVDRAADCLAEATRIASPLLPSLRWARLAIELGRGQLPDFPEGLAPGSSPWAPRLMARIAFASGGIKALSATLPELPGGGAELGPLAALAGVEAGGPSETKSAGPDPDRAYLKGMQARLLGKTSAAAELLAKALGQHADACRAAGEYVAAYRELGRVPNADAFGWLRHENAGCVNLPAAAAAATEHRSRHVDHFAPIPR